MDLIERQAAIDALEAYAKKYNAYPIAVYDAVGVLHRVPPAQPHTYRGVTLNDVMMYFDSLEDNEDAWTEFCSCFECRGWRLYHIRSATDKNVGTNDDCISRKQAIDAMCTACGNDCDKSKFIYNAPRTEQVILCPEHYALSRLLSAQPQRTGHWIPVGMAEAVGGESAQWGSAVAYHKCSECDGQALRDDFEQEVLSKWCPHCGAKMEGVSE